MHPHRFLAPGLALAGLALSSLTPARSLAAQDKVVVDTAKSGTLVKKGEPLFTLRDAAIAGGFALATVALFPADRRIAGKLQDPTRQTNRFFHHAATGVEYIASPGAYVIGGTLYAIGRLGGFDRLADLGWHGTEAVLVSQITTEVLKGLAGRARPFVTADTNASDFGFGRGFKQHTNYSSFPSGHASTAFAAAAAVTSETSKWWPHSTWYVAPVMYGGATLVGLSRMYHNKHWASDVALGAAIGTFSGLKVTQYAHANPKNRLDRIMLRAKIVVPDATTGSGPGVGYSLSFGGPKRE